MERKQGAAMPAPGWKATGWGTGRNILTEAVAAWALGKERQAWPFLRFGFWR